MVQRSYSLRTNGAKALAKVAPKDDDSTKSNLLEASNLLAVEDLLNLKATVSPRSREKELKGKGKKAYKKLFA